MKEQERYSYLLDGIGVKLGEGKERPLQIAENLMKRVSVPLPSLHFRLYRRAVDARKRNDIKLVWTVLVESETVIPTKLCEKVGLKPQESETEQVQFGTEPMIAPPLVVGMGPAGLFTALHLAQNGYRPTVIDRGDKVADRVRKVERFKKYGILDSESNIQFGAGGAGTFSDGKLVTRIHDSRCRSVLETFYRFGASEEILTLAKPHIGTDILRTVVDNILNEIERLGGRVLYNCRAEKITENADGTVTVDTACGKINASAVVLAIGHSAKDIYGQLIEKGFAVEAKPMSVGVRIEHLQSDIDRALYGEFAGHPELGHAEYALSDTKRERGVYTFCMCPGGEVVPASSDEGQLVTNGMSNSKRDGKNANSAVLVSVGTNDYEKIDGSTALGAIGYQTAIEKKAFSAGGGDWYAPMMTVGDFLGGKVGSDASDIIPTYRDGLVRPSDFGDVFPNAINESLRYALHQFGKKIEGFDKPSAILTGAETRTSAPVRILRDKDLLSALGHANIYPCGEGAGYAGGITSSAVDGIKVAEKIMERFKPFDR